MNISANSRVWVYQSDRPFTQVEEIDIQERLDRFIGDWQAHGHQLAAAFEIRYSRFIILFVDEEIAGATGCSIDKSVNLMKTIEQEFKVQLFNRFNIAYRENQEVLSCEREEFEKLIATGKINENSIVFNNLIQTKAELETAWEVPFKASWHARVFTLIAS